MRWRTGVTAGAAMVLMAMAARGEEPAGPTGRAWQDMDYGPFAGASIEAPLPGGGRANIAYKGIAIRLDSGDGGVAQGRAFMLFDADLMRFSAAWTGQGFIDWRSIVYDGSHGTHPSIVGEQAFGTAVAPGWANPATGTFDDPRNKGLDGRTYGPLPRDWARYRGLYVHGDRVVLAYTVGDVHVLESPSIEERDELTLFVRTINLGKSSSDLLLRVADDPSGTVQLLNGDTSQRSVAVLGSVKRDDAQPVGGDEAALRRGLTAHWRFDDADAWKAANRVAEQLHGRVLDAQRVDGPEGTALRFDGNGRVDLADSNRLKVAGADYTISAWVRTTQGGSIFSIAPAQGKWAPNGRTFFVRGGRLCFDIGWVGVVASTRTVADGRWHHVAVTVRGPDGATTLFIDGKADGSKRLHAPRDETHVARIGYTATDFVPPFRGDVAEVRFHQRLLEPAEVAALAHASIEQTAFAARYAASSKGVEWLEPSPGTLALRIPRDSTPVSVNVVMWRGKAKDVEARFIPASAAIPPANDLTHLTRGGPARLAQVITTKGTRGSDSKPFAVDVITPPTENPWRSWMRLGGFDFFADGRRAAVCTWNGDVWKVEGIDDDLSQLRWRRIATGLFQPLGLKIVDDAIYVCCRDQIVRLHDLNGDGEADWHESFNNDHIITEHFHEFAMDLQRDAAGAFYYTKGARHAADAVVAHHGTLLKVSADGLSTEVVAHGFRAPNGLGFGPNGSFLVSDQEGHWTPMNRLNLVKPGGFYGYMQSYHPGERPTDYDRPICWIHKSVDRSPAAMLMVESDRFGLPRGSILSTSYGTGEIHHVLHEEVEGQIQGGIVTLPIIFDTGVMRGRFRPVDGQLYVCGLFGWSSNRTSPGGFYRVRYTGKPLNMPVGLNATKDGVRITFSDPLDREEAGLADNYAVERWDYKWLPRYGSDEWKVSDGTPGRDAMVVERVEVSDDGRTVFLRMPDMRPAMQMQIRYRLDTAGGEAIAQTITHTVHRLGR